MKKKTIDLAAGMPNDEAITVELPELVGQLTEEQLEFVYSYLKNVGFPIPKEQFKTNFFSMPVENLLTVGAHLTRKYRR